jgi:hypothetical protein
MSEVTESKLKLTFDVTVNNKIVRSKSSINKTNSKIMEYTSMFMD